MLPYYKRKDLYNIYLQEVRKFISHQTVTDLFIKNMFELAPHIESKLSIVTFIEASVVFNYYPVFKAQKIFGTNEHNNVDKGLWEVIDKFNKYQQHNSHPDKIEITNLYDENLKVMY